jgi:hypothetical protein
LSTIQHRIDNRARFRKAADMRKAILQLHPEERDQHE